MNKFKTFLSKYKYFILVNLIILVSYILISSTVDLFGIDDTIANSYIYNPEFTFLDHINKIIYRIVNWNARIGEILYFIIGCFPRFVYFSLSSIVFLLFLNLVYFYIYGTKAKEYFNKKQYYLSILSSYIICLTLFPAFSEVLIWMAGVFNHLWDTVIVLLAGIPFRLLLDNYDIFSKHKKLKYFYFVLCIFSGFSVENVTPWLIAYMGIITFTKIIKKNVKPWMIISVIITSINFLIMCIINSTILRKNFFIDMEWAINSKKNLITTFLNNYKFIFILISILLLIYILLEIINKNLKNSFKKLILIMTHIIVSTISIFVIYLSPYFETRVTTLFFFFLLNLIVFLLHNIFNKNFICYLVIIINIIIIIIMTDRLIFFYKDFNYYNNLRYNYIKSQYESGIKNISCPVYDNKYNYFYSYRLTHYESFYCDGTYIKYLLNDDNIEVNWDYNTILR